MSGCPEDRIVHTDDYDPDDVEWLTKHGTDVDHIREIHGLAESLGWFVWKVFLPDEDSGGGFFCDTYHCLRNTDGEDIGDVTDIDAGMEDESLTGLLEFWEPHLREMKEERDANS